MKIRLYKNWHLDLKWGKVAALLAIAATAITIATGVITLIDKATERPMWEQSIPLDELEKYRKGNGTIRIEKGITITPEESSNERTTDAN